jgi:hypothetical protein
MRGLYIYRGDVGQNPASYNDEVMDSLKVPGPNGLVLVIGWNEIEPSQHDFHWELLDRWMQAAAENGKQVDLVVKAGNATPGWLFVPKNAGGAGAAKHTFTVSPHQGKTNKFIAESIAAPWDPAFLEAWDTMLSGVSDHLKAKGTYGSVALLRLTGINRTTDEFRLPAETPADAGQGVSNAVEIWKEAGYRPSLLLQGWDALISSFQRHFPDKAYSIAIIPYASTHQYAFPPIDDNGNIIHGKVPDQNEPLLALAAQKFPGRLVVQFNFLINGKPAAHPVVKVAQTLKTMPAFQTNNYYGQSFGGAAASGTVQHHVKCTDETFLTLLEVGIYPLGKERPMRSEYIEVFPANVLAFHEAVAAAQKELVSGPTHVLGPPLRRRVRAGSQSQ